MSPAPLGDVRRVLLHRGRSLTRRADDPVVSRAFRRVGVEVEFAAQSVQAPDAFDLVVAIGDPIHAGQRALEMGVPILPVESSERLLALVDNLADLVVRRHWVPRLRLNGVRTRVVFCDARVTSTATAVPIDVHEGATVHRLASMQCRMHDPFGLPHQAPGSPAVGCVGERPDGLRVTMPVPGRTIFEVRPCGPRERLHVIVDGGHYQAVADRVELGPTRAIRVAHPS